MIRIATYNVMNLFSRPKPLAVADWDEGKPVLEDIARLNDLLDRKKYSSVKTEIAQILKRNNLANRARKDDKFRINQIRKKLYTNPETGKINVVAAGRDSWLGWIELVPELLHSEAVKNTARVIDEVDADVLCLVEVEDRLTLDRFHDDILVEAGFLTTKSRGYQHNMLVDGNDKRGIDVGLYSRFPIECVYSHIDDTYTSGNKAYPVFSRDCPEFAVELPSGDTLPDLSFEFRFARAVRIITIDDVTQTDATAHFDNVVQDIERCVDAESAHESIVNHWSAGGDEATCAACDFRHFCPNPAPRSGQHVIKTPGAP